MMYFQRIISGIVIGIGWITPGLSGGVIAAALGIYEPCLNALANIWREPRAAVKLIWPYALGLIVGVLLFSSTMSRLITEAHYPVMYVFIGLVLGSLPQLMGEAAKDGLKWKQAIIALPAFVLVVVVEPIISTLPVHAESGGLSVVGSLISGATYAIGSIIPGLSASFLLMAMGAYDKFLYAIANLELGTLFMIGCGFLLMALVLVKVCEYMFRKFRGYAYWTVVGLLLGSILISFPGFETGWEFARDIALLIVSTVGCYFAMNRMSLKG